jgi:parallel beta-helix repeat protein
MRRSTMWIAFLAFSIVFVPLPAGAENPEPAMLEVTASTVLDGDHYGSVLIVASGVTLDCAGYTIHGPGVLERPNDPPGEDNGRYGGIGVEADDVTVKNCKATGFEGGAFNVSGNSSTLKGNVAYDNGAGFGFRGDGHVIQGNTSLNSEVNAFLLQVGSNSLLRGNRAEGSQAAFSLELVNDIDLIGNTAVGGGEGVGFEIAGSSGNTLRGNTSSGYDVGFSVAPAEDFESFERVESNDNTLVGNSATSNNGPGFIVSSGSNHVFQKNNASRNGWAGYVVTNALATEEFPIEFIMFDKNDASRNGSGFFIFGDTGVTITNNTAKRNDNGFVAYLGSGEDIVFNRNTGCKNTETDAVDVADPLAAWTNNNFCAPDETIPLQ